MERDESAAAGVTRGETTVLAAPGVLIFTMGAVWGTVDEATVYHYEQGNFYPIVSTPRRLK